MNHGVTIEVNHREPDGTALQWRANCTCGATTFFAPDYPQVEDRWREHVYLVTGDIPEPFGEPENRWRPEPASTPT